MSIWSFVDVDKLDKYPVYQKHDRVSVGDSVEISDPIRHGTVKFIGATEFGGPYKIWYGIELKKPWAKSKTDGTVRGIKYFETSRPKTGVFVLRNKIKVVIRRLAYELPLETLSEEKSLDELSMAVLTLRRIVDFLPSYGKSEEFEKLSQKRFPSGRSLTTPTVKHSISLSWIDSDEEVEVHERQESKTPIIRNVASLQNINEGCPFSLLTTTEDFKPSIKRTTSDGSVKSDTLKRGDTFPFLHISTTIRREIVEEIENDPMMMAISEGAKANLNSRASLLNLIADLQRCTNLINFHLPKVTEQLQKASADKIYATNVIQELLKRVQKEQKSTKIRDDFTGRKSIRLESNTEYNSSDIDAMVNVTAWMRNNIRVSALMDENDAKMCSMGAAEVRESLIRILLSVTEENERTPLKKLTMQKILSNNLRSPGQSRSSSLHLVQDFVEFVDIKENGDVDHWV